MRTVRFPSALVAACVLPGACLALSAQPAGSDEPPVRVELSSVRRPNGQEVSSWRVTNVSRKEVRAYVAVLESSGNEAGCRRVHVSVFGLDPLAQDRLRPGEQRQDRIGAMGGGAPQRATVDFVLFTDGSTWGPDTQHKSLLIQGLLQGRRALLAQLKRVLETQGVEAVVKILNAPEEP